MTTMWDTGKVSISDLVGHVRDSELALPQFQRLSVWGKADWIPFLLSVLRNRPTGTLLLLEVGSDGPGFEVRPLDRAPALKGTKNLKWLLLDGQQRTTTIYNALGNGFEGAKGGKREIVLKVRQALERGEVSEEDLEVVASSRVKADAEMAKKGELALRTALHAGQFQAWTVSYAAKHLGPPEDTVQALVGQLDSTLPGLTSLPEYSFPVLRVKENTPLDVVVDVFEGMNRRGQRLNQFDLMVARLYKELPDGSRYDLRRTWADALDQCDYLGRVGVDESEGMLPLQLIAMQVSRHLSKIKGLSSRDVLEVPPEQIIGHKSMKPLLPKLSLITAVNALESAAEFLYTKCGVISAQLLPQLSMLLPIADQFLQPQGSRLKTHQLKQWFFASGLSSKYYGGVNSLAAADCKALLRWAEHGDDGRPSVVAEFNRSEAMKLDLQQEMSREADILGTSLMALLVTSGAQDWRKGQMSLLTLDEAVDFHHVVPHLTLKKLGLKGGALRSIAGFTPISASVNRSIRDKNPDQVLTELKRDATEILASHHADAKLLKAATQSKASWEAFLKNREERLRKFVVKSLGL